MGKTAKEKDRAVSSASSQTFPSKGNSLWVGVQEAANRILVYDPTLQKKNEEYVYLFDVYNYVMKKFPRTAIRQQLESLEDRDQYQRAIKLFQTWEKQYRRNFIAQELKIIKKSPPKSKPKTKVKTQKPVRKQNRSSPVGCNDCGQELSDDTDDHCPKCGFILCPRCGACMC